MPQSGVRATLHLPGSYAKAVLNFSEGWSKFGIIFFPLPL